jgi:hypothetical protein
MIPSRSAMEKMKMSDGVYGAGTVGSGTIV